MKLFKRRLRAFSLAEILVAIAILAVISLLILPRLFGKTEKSRRAAAVMDIEHGLSAALDDFESDNGFFPSSEQGLKALVEKPSISPETRNWNGPYLKKKSYIDPWGSPYQYRNPGSHNSKAYDLYSFGADGKEGGEGNNKDVVNWE
ncbi:MAG: type II secretion system major pseudopilin GspG [Spirochaetia bacterium]|nr:type II secretion system major pseudopilin GspG [Spirochaetia bacterium]